MAVYFITALTLLLVTIGCSSKPVIDATQDNKSAVAAKTTTKKIVPGATSPGNKFFVDVSKDLGLEGVKAVRLYAVDLNGDNYSDLAVLPGHYSIPEFYLFKPKVGKFIKMNAAPFAGVVRASFLAFADFNKDKVYDMVAVTLNQKTELTKYPMRMFKGVRNKSDISFVEVNGAFPKHIDPTSSISIFDFNMDGHLDIYVGNWFDLSKKGKPKPAPDRLYEGKKFKFTDKSYLLEGELEYSRSQELYINAAPTFGVSICDIDQNGYSDIMTSNSSGFGNKMWMSLKNNSKNPGARIFKDYGVESGYGHDSHGSFKIRGGGNSTYSKCADYNNDGVMDLALGEIVYSYDNIERDKSSVLTGSSREFPPKFLRAEYTMSNNTKHWNQGDQRGVWIDYNGDGLQDLLVDNSGFPPQSRLMLFEQMEDHAFTEKSKTLGIDILNPSGTVTIDFNKDGKMDFITGQTSIRSGNLKTRIYAFKNTTKLSSKSYTFYLSGKLANVDGIGGMIILTTDKGSYRSVVDTIYGPRPAQNQLGNIFYLPPGEEIERVEVRWPYLVGSRRGGSRPLIREYRIPKGKSLNNIITLCENGKWRRGKRGCFL